MDGNPPDVRLESFTSVVVNNILNNVICILSSKISKIHKTTDIISCPEKKDLKYVSRTDVKDDLIYLSLCPSSRPRQLPVVCWLLFSGQSVAGDLSRRAASGPGL